MTDIIERLRDSDCDGRSGCGILTEDAADEIERLRLKIATTGGGGGPSEIELSQLAEIERLRAALTRVSNCNAVGGATDGPHEHAITIARDVLGLKSAVKAGGVMFLKDPMFYVYVGPPVAFGVFYIWFIGTGLGIWR